MASDHSKRQGFITRRLSDLHKSRMIIKTTSDRHKDAEERGNIIPAFRLYKKFCSMSTETEVYNFFLTALLKRN
jgi:hypothetical protein